MANGDSQLDVPEGYTPWVVETDEKDAQGNPIKKLVVDDEGKVILCDECPCMNQCWWLYESTCTFEKDENGEEIVVWSEPELIEAKCMPTPAVVDQWFWVRYATVHYYVTDNIECSTKEDLCAERTPPEVAKPTFTECCEFVKLKEGVVELPYEWSTIFDHFEEDPDTGDLSPVYRNIKVYRDIKADSPVYLGSYSAGDCDWVDWTIEIQLLQGTISAVYSYPCTADTKTEELGTAYGEPFSTAIKLYPGWRVDLFLTTDFADRYNALWKDPEAEHLDAKWSVVGLLKSEACISYCYALFYAECISDGGECKVVSDVMLSNTFKSQIHPPKPYNGQYWDRHSGWLTENEEDPTGPFRPINSTSKQDTSAWYVIRLCASINFPDWLKNSCTTPIECDAFEVPRRCASDPDATDNDDDCPPVPDLKCCTDYNKTLYRFVTNRSKPMVDLTAFQGPGMACPGARWRIRDMGDERRPGYDYDVHSDWGKGHCGPEDDQNPYGCGSIYETGYVDETGTLVGLPDKFRHALCYNGYMALQVMCPTKDGRDNWPQCN